MSREKKPIVVRWNVVETPPPRRWVRYCLIGAIVMGAIVAAIPSIIAATSLRHRFAQSYFPGIHGTVHVGSARAGWFCSIELNDVRMLDDNGALLVHIPRLAAKQTFGELLIRPSRHTGVVFESPVFEIRRHHHTSNFETVFAEWLAPPTTGFNRVRRWGDRIQITDGVVRIHDRSHRKEWTFAPVNVSMDISRDTAPAIDLRATACSCLGQAADHACANDLMEIEYHRSAPKPGKPIAAELTVRGRGLPLGLAAPLVLRNTVGSTATTCEGLMRYQVRTVWGASIANQPAFAVEAEFSANDCVLIGAIPGISKGINLGHTELRGKLIQQGARTTIQDAEFACALGRAALRGSAPIPTSLAGLLLSLDFDVEAWIDLARLAAAMDMVERGEIIGGQANVKIHRDHRNNAENWTTRITTTDCVAICDGQHRLLEPPLALTAAWSRTSEAVHIHELACVTPFVDLRATGALHEVKTDAIVDTSADLDHWLALFDSEPLNCALRGVGKGVVSHQPDGNIDVNSHIEWKEVQIFGMGPTPVRSRDVATTLTANATWKDGLVVESCRMEIKPHQVTVTLLEPIRDVANSAWGPLRITEPTDHAANAIHRVYPSIGQLLLAFPDRATTIRR